MTVNRFIEAAIFAYANKVGRRRANDHADEKLPSSADDDDDDEASCTAAAAR